MKKVKEHGYYKYETQCNKCNCVFEYEIPDIKDDTTVNCPDCGSKCLHFAHNYLFTSQIKDICDDECISEGRCNHNEVCLDN